MLLPRVLLPNGLFLFQSPAPSPFIKEMMDAGQFYTNRVLKDWKDKSKSHVEWTKAWLATLQVRLLGIGSRLGNVFEHLVLGEFFLLQSSSHRRKRIFHITFVCSVCSHFSQVGLLISKLLYDGKRAPSQRQHNPNQL